MAVCPSAAPTGVSVRALSLIAGQWHAFELVHYDSGDSPALSARVHCPGIPGDAFPFNAADPSPRRAPGRWRRDLHIKLHPWAEARRDLALHHSCRSAAHAHRGTNGRSRRNAWRWWLLG